MPIDKEGMILCLNLKQFILKKKLPKAIYFEKEIENYELGKQLLKKYKEVPKLEIENHKTSDYLVPYTSSGCTAACMYCYLVCNYNNLQRDILHFQQNLIWLTIF